MTFCFHYKESIPEPHTDMVDMDMDTVMDMDMVVMVATDTKILWITSE